MLVIPDHVSPPAIPPAFSFLVSHSYAIFTYEESDMKLKCGDPNIG